MAADAHTFIKGGTDEIIVMETRRHLVQPFRADAWLDLRIGFFVSLTTAGANDTITGLTETIASIGNINPPDSRYWIGIKTEGDAMPVTAGTVFIGFSNCSHAESAREEGASKLVSSDLGNGTSNTNYWRTTNDGVPVDKTVFICDGGLPRSFATQDYPHFVQNVGGAGGYATLLAIRLQRDNPTSRTLRVSIPKTIISGNVGSADVEFTNTPTLAELRNKLVNFPASVYNFPAVELTRVPSALFFYWPWFNSRLRFSAIDVLKFA